MKTTYSSARFPSAQTANIEWATLGLFAVCYCSLGAALWILPLGIAIPVLALALVLHASLTHEVCHGHPLPSRIASEALVWINPGLMVPYLRFRDTHLAHHQDAVLTDPYDDPESNFLDPKNWHALPKWKKRLFEMNNRLAGRMLLGPIIGQVAFMTSDIRAIFAGDGQVLRGWLWHCPGVVLVLSGVSQSQMPLWLYAVCTYAAVSILKIRTFLEHQAHERVRGRTVIIEDRGLLSFLFLNNNLHAVHHMHPRVPWYQLPAMYYANSTRYLSCNDGYRYPSYSAVFRSFLWRAKDPVAHPLWPSPKD